LAQQKAHAVLNTDRLSTFTFNDTIIFSLSAEREQLTTKEVSAFFLLLRKFMVDSLQKGILFRGSVALGSFYADKATNTVMGEAVTDAASWYSKADWVGIHATPRASIVLNGLLERENKTRDYAMVDYDVPMKGGPPMKLKAVNWPKALFVDGLTPEETRIAPKATALSWFGRQPIPAGAEGKCFNAIAFFDHVVARQKLTPRLQADRE